MLGVMIDCSRNAVMSCDAVKQYVDLLSKMGYDTLMLYTEDTYEVNYEPYFGYMRGKYTKAELKELDAYCLSKGIELIPCIQTLAHLNAIFQASDVYGEIRDCDDILLIDHARTYELLEHIFDTVEECFTTGKIHIGMDEASKVGLGKYMKQHGFTNRFDLINHHLHKVCAMADKYGFEPMVWSDMFCALAEEDENMDAVREKAKLPEKVSLVFWDYYSDDFDSYVKRLKVCRQFERPVLFAGGAWTWKGFMPDNAFSIKNTEVAVRACRASGVNDVLMTIWGDDGAECSKYAVLPTLLYTAEMMHGNMDMAEIQKKFCELTKMKWDDFMLLDQLDALVGKHRHNPSKYLLYNDPFMGLNDGRVETGDNAYYKELEQKLQKVSATPEYQPLFDTAIALCKVLSVKSELGVHTRKAYLDSDKPRLKEIATEDYDKVLTYLEEFYQAFLWQWETENKPFGFDIQDIRIGGLKQRLEHCRKKLLDFVDGRLARIPELEETVLERAGSIAWSSIATPNVVSHVFYG